MKKDCVLCQPLQNEELLVQGEKWRVILAAETTYPGFCRVIWQDHIAEMTDLKERDREELMRVVWLVEKAIRDVMAPEKINLASLGNMVPHLHWHVIPRFSDDVHFPESVWGKNQRELIVSVLEKRRAMLPELKRVINALLSK